MEKAEVLPLQESDLDEVAANVRAADTAEITEALGIPMRQGLSECLGSLKASKIVINGEIVAVFGDAVHCTVNQIGVPWLISTVHVEKYPKAFLQVCKPEVEDMLTRHASLINYVDVRNTVAIRWLKWLGFQFFEPEPYGPYGMPFMKFTMERT